ncbi:OprO/OprP family phosphate-selective porin [Alienimonas californiensis]|uniref:Phosphate-selective porin O and P n=1 Tax=Alienimonas californiensis TaxID=2527989 RepID=A0A517P8M5_9PLAN|nr:porin [Alienimonas californiensis]QDT15715.1 Phosphate-selective porin O and P [Alienimonas californiensis]
MSRSPARWIARGAFVAPAAFCSVGLADDLAPAGTPPVAADAIPVAVAEDAISAGDFRALVDRLDRAEAEVRTLRTRLDAPFVAAELDALPPAPLFRPAGYQAPDPTDRDVTDQGEAELALNAPAPTSDSSGGAEFDARLRELEDLFGDQDGGEALTEQFKGLDVRIGEVESGLGDFVTRGTSNSTAQLFGRLHADYWAFPSTDEGAERFEGENPQDRLLFRRLRFGLQGDIRTNMFYKFETEFADPNDFEFRDAFFGFRDVPFLQTVVVGNQKRPYGLDHLNSSRYNVFMERPNVIEAFNEDNRRLGAVSYGVSDDLRYNWRYGIYNLERIQDDGSYIGDAYQLQVAGRLATTYWWDECSDGRGYGHFAVAGTIADPDETGGPQNNNEARFRTRPEARTDGRWLNTGRIDDVENFSLIGLEHVLNYGAVQWVSEAQVLSNDRFHGAEDADFWGGYTYVSYFLTGEHMPWDRESGTLDRIKPHEDFFLVRDCHGRCGGGWGAWQVAARYSYLDLNDADVFGGEAESVTLGLNWYWNQNAGMQFNWVNGNIKDSSVVDVDGGEGAPIDSRYDILGVRFRLDF